ncbi:MAG: DUF805 domain-containing protein [Candidatus Nanopelagicales bacterium]
MLHPGAWCNNPGAFSRAVIPEQYDVPGPSVGGVRAAVTAVYNVGWLSTIWSLVVLLPTIAVSVRRLHDVDKSGW